MSDRSGRLDRPDPLDPGGRDAATPPSTADPRSNALRTLGDPELGATLVAAASSAVAHAAPADRRSQAAPTPLDLFATRRRDAAAAARAAACSARAGRASLRVELAWGRAVVGPFTRPGAPDACAGCAPAATPEVAGSDEDAPAEPVLLPGLVAAIVACELDRWRRGAVPATRNAELHVVPYRSWAAATRPVLVRQALVRRPSCAFCGASTDASTERALRVVRDVFSTPLSHPAPGGLRPPPRGVASGRKQGDDGWNGTWT